MITYAQNFEDVMLARLFAERDAGFYVDIGAGDPTHLSVTRHFYERGWRGINVEPIRANWERFAKERPRDINLNVAIAGSPGRRDFCEVVDNDALSSLDAGRIGELTASGVRTRRYEVECVTGESVFERAPPNVDFLKVDVEGFEDEVLRSIDLAKRRPKVLVIEAAEYTAQFPGWANWSPQAVAHWQTWERYVLQAGYVFAHFDGLNRFYVRKDLRHLCTRLSVPPGVFDFILPDLREALNRERLASESAFGAALGEKEGVIQVLKVEVERSTENWEHADRAMQEKEGVIRTLQTAVETLTSQHEVLTSQHEAGRHQAIASAHASAAEAREQNVALLKVLADKDGVIQVLKVEVERSTENWEHADRAMQEKEGVIRTLQTAVETLTSQHEVLTSQHEAGRHQAIASAHASAAEACEQNVALLKALADKDGALQALQRAVDTLEDQHKVLVSASAFAPEPARQQAALLKVIAEKEAVIQELSGALQAFRSAYGVVQHVVGPMRALGRAGRAVANLPRQILAPRLGVLYQHAPRDLRLPSRYVRPVKLVHAPEISIVTPSFRQAEFIERTLRSVLEQSYPKLEYFVQDGGSQDGTREILERFADRLAGWDSRPDGGQAEAVNLGFARTKGEIMGWINSDDILLPGALACVGDFFQRHPDVDVVYGHRVLIDENDRQIGRWVMPAHDDEVLSWADYVPQETLFWRRRLWEKVGARVDESFRFALDWDLLVRFREAGARFARLPRFIGGFRIHSQQKTSAAISDIGFQEMDRIRQRVLGRVPTRIEVRNAVAPYLMRHVLSDIPWRIRDRLGGAA